MVPALNALLTKTMLIKALIALGIILGVYVLSIVLIYLFKDRLQYYPDANAYTLKQVGTKDFTDFPVTTADGLPVKGWYVPPRGRLPTLVVFHGNASTYQWRAPDFERVNAYGYGVLLVGYRGYGGNPGKPSEQALYDDAAIYLKELKARNHLYDRDIILYGESLGTGIAVEMARQNPKIRGIILENPYTTMADLARYHYPLIPFADKMVKNRYDNLSKMAALGRMPKFFMIAGRDTIVPPKFGEALYTASGLPKKLKIYPEAGHIDVRRQGGLEDIRAFLAQFEN